MNAPTKTVMSGTALVTFPTMSMAALTATFFRQAHHPLVALLLLASLLVQAPTRLIVWVKHPCN